MNVPHGAKRAVAVLDRIHAADPTVLPALIEFRVACNRKVGDDPTVQIGTAEHGAPICPWCGAVLAEWDHDTDCPRSGPRLEASGSVGLLGVINGLFGADENGVGFIAACYADDGTGPLTGFKLNR
ncbi:MAG: hypothetical protein ACRDXE_07440 [Acidimicrobiales bacterium]